MPKWRKDAIYSKPLTFLFFKQVTVWAPNQEMSCSQHLHSVKFKNPPKTSNMWSWISTNSFVSWVSMFCTNMCSLSRGFAWSLEWYLLLLVFLSKLPNTSWPLSALWRVVHQQGRKKKTFPSFALLFWKISAKDIYYSNQ